MRNALSALLAVAACAALAQDDSASSLLARLPEAPKARTEAPAKNDRTISFSFERVDIRVFAQVVGNFTGRKFVVADDTDGAITVISPDVTQDEAYALFAAVLESSGFTLVREGDVDRVVRLPDHKGAGMGTIVPDGESLPGHGLITRILHLEHVSADDMRRMLETQLQRKDSISILEETNHLVITDTSDTIRRVEELVRQLDKPGMARVNEVVPLKHADAAALARQLGAVFAENQSRAQQLLGRVPASAGSPSGIPSLRAPVILPSEHSNALIVTGSQRQLESVRELVAKLDVPAPTGRSGLNVIPLNYLKAADLAKNVTSLLEKFAAGGSDQTLARRIAVEAVEASNALLVNAAPEDFREVKALVDSLDVMPRQVHISVLIAEVSDGDEETLGLQYNFAGTGHGSSFGGGFHPMAETPDSLASRVSSQVYPEGIAFGLVNRAGTTIAAVNVDALKQNSKVKILANPTLGAQNNTEASVSIVDNIPMTEATISGTGADRDVIQNITRYDVGVKLSLTPHIIPDGLVQIELEPSIEAVTKESSSESGFAPTISKRSVKTTMTVPDGETIVIAGLSRADRTTVRRKVPLLGSIPLLGWFFRWNSEVETKTNILIFVTPTVMDDAADAAAVKADQESRTGLRADDIGKQLKAH